MPRRPGASLVESLLVLAIIALMVGLLLPAVQSTRRRAIELQCQNNVRQLNLAVVDYFDAQKRLPGPGTPGRVGGWPIDILPHLDQKPLADRAAPGLSVAAAPDFLRRQPAVFRCPVRDALEAPPSGSMWPAEYVFLADAKRKHYFVADAPLGLSAPWAEGPEFPLGSHGHGPGPHRGGYFASGGFHDGVSYSNDL